MKNNFREDLLLHDLQQAEVYLENYRRARARVFNDIFFMRFPLYKRIFWILTK